MCAKIRRDEVRNEPIKNVDLIPTCDQCKTLRWFGHIERIVLQNKDVKSERVENNSASLERGVQKG